MCGRYSLAPKKQQKESLAKVADVPADLPVSYNIAPVQQACVIANDHPHQLQLMQWGLVPHWSKDGKNSGKLINARAESVAEKPSFREPAHSRRCLVPADSFYEWRKEPGGAKTPYRIFLHSGELLFMAGIWDEWQENGTTKRTFSIITTTPNAEMATLHDRMPVIFADARERELWLSDAPLEAVLPLLKPVGDGMLSMYRVSDKLNKVGYDGADLQEELPEVWRLF
jgi:putative SOS response-associated peptidase YedK